MVEQDQPGKLAPRASWEMVKHKLVRWIVFTIDPLLLVVHLTLIYVAFLIADDFLLAQITRSFGDLISKSAFAAALLQGTKIFAALGTAIAYALHLIYSLYLQASHVVKALKESVGAGGT